MFKRTVLIAENDGIISLDIKSLLKRNNYKPVMVRSAKDLLEHYKSNKPDLIIADLFLGKESNEAVLKEINKVDNTPIIIISGSSKVLLEKIKKDLFPCDYLAKPFESEELLKLVKEMTGGLNVSGLPT